MAKIANVALTNTFNTWRINSNIAFDRLSQFTITNSSLYANTITANVAFTSTGLATLSGRATVGTNLTVSGNTTLGAAGKTITTTGAAAHTGTTTISTNLTVSGNTSITGITTLGAGAILGTPASGNLSTCTADGTDQVGFKNIPQNSQSAAYTCVLADSGKHIFHPSSDANARTFTIPANSSVAYPIGTALTFVNMTAAVVTIAITTDTMYLSSAGTTGSRSLAQYGSATALKLTTTTWLISGSGLT